MPEPWLLAGAGAFGWLWGSFLNTLVDRTPRRDGTGAPPGWFAPPRSLCLSCGAPVAWFDNLPIVSYLALRGRCRACRAPIGARTLAMEVATPLAFTVAAWLLMTRGTAPSMAVWTFTTLSWGLVAVPTAMERRRMGWVLIAGVALLGIGFGLD